MSREIFSDLDGKGNFHAIAMAGDPEFERWQLWPVKQSIRMIFLPVKPVIFEEIVRLQALSPGWPLNGATLEIP